LNKKESDEMLGKLDPSEYARSFKQNRTLPEEDGADALKTWQIYWQSNVLPMATIILNKRRGAIILQCAVLRGHRRGGRLRGLSLSL